jgi:hypothetical protein
MWDEFGKLTFSCHDEWLEMILIVGLTHLSPGYCISPHPITGEIKSHVIAACRNPRSLQSADGVAEICRRNATRFQKFLQLRLTSSQSRMKLGSTESSSCNIIIAISAIVPERFEHALNVSVGARPTCRKGWGPNHMGLTMEGATQCRCKDRDVLEISLSTH